MVGSGERFNTAVTVTCTVGLVIVLQRMRALQRQVDTLAELVRGQETSLQWLTQRMETPVIRVSFSGSIHPHTTYPHIVPVLLLCPPLHQPWPRQASGDPAASKGLSLPPPVRCASRQR